MVKTHGFPVDFPLNQSIELHFTRLLGKPENPRAPRSWSNIVQTAPATAGRPLESLEDWDKTPAVGRSSGFSAWMKYIDPGSHRGWKMNFH